MHSSQLHYLPLPLPYFSVLVLLFLVLIVLIQLGAWHYAYRRLGVSSWTALLLLLGSLLGSYLNIPVAQLPEHEIASGQVVHFFGMQHVVPAVVDWPGTIIAVNVGGALIPGLMSLYLLAKHSLWVSGITAIGVVAAICHWLAQPVPGVGIAMPLLVPAFAAGGVAVVLSRQRAAPLAYIGGCLGTLTGADLLNLGSLQGLGVPVASIGGAGTFDGIFVTSIVAVLIASFPWWPDRVPSNAPSPSGQASIRSQRRWP